MAVRQENEMDRRKTIIFSGDRMVQVCLSENTEYLAPTIALTRLIRLDRCAGQLKKMTSG